MYLHNLVYIFISCIMITDSAEIDSFIGQDSSPTESVQLLNSIVNENSSSFRNIGEQSVPLVVPPATAASSDSPAQLPVTPPPPPGAARLPPTSTQNLFTGQSYPASVDFGARQPPENLDFFNVIGENNNNEPFVPKFFNPGQFEARSPTQIDSSVLIPPPGPSVRPTSGI